MSPPDGRRDGPYATPRAAAERRSPPPSAPKPSNTLSWLLSVAAVAVVGAGQVLYASGSNTGLGIALIVAGGVALAAVIARAALRGLR